MGYFRIIDVEVGDTYYIHVKPYTNFGVTNQIENNSSTFDDNSITITGKNIPLMAPTNLQVWYMPFAVKRVL